MAAGIGSVLRRSQQLNRFGGVKEDAGGQPFNHERPCQAERLTLDDNYLYGYVYDVNDVHNDDDDNEFVRCIKKRARRFYLDGFNALGANKMFNFVNKWGPTVTWIRIWNSKKKNYDETVIRLNAVDNSNADLLLDRYFWPAGVICRPWKNKAERFSCLYG